MNFTYGVQLIIILSLYLYFLQNDYGSPFLPIQTTADGILKLLSGARVILHELTENRGSKVIERLTENMV